MKVAYVDSSVLVAIAFGEKGYRKQVKRLQAYDRLVSSNLLEAELSSALVREDVSVDPGGLLSHLDWLFPHRPLTPEYSRVLDCGYVRGADLWHLACALFLSPGPEDISFVTLDHRQRTVALALGFAENCDP
jgi:predicted nucleic acid-binding protein